MRRRAERRPISAAIRLEPSIFRPREYLVRVTESSRARGNRRTMRSRGARSRWRRPRSAAPRLVCGLWRLDRALARPRADPAGGAQTAARIGAHLARDCAVRRAAPLVFGKAPRMARDHSWNTGSTRLRSAPARIARADRRALQPDSSSAGSSKSHGAQCALSTPYRAHRFRGSRWCRSLPLLRRPGS